MALVKMKDLLRRAEEKNIGCGAFSVGNMEMVRGAIRAAEELDTPIILQIAEVRLKNSPLHLMGPMMVQAAKEAKVDVAVHLDHGLKKETCLKALELGFSSIMYDCSTDSYEDNVRKVKEMADIAHSYGATIEGELGHVGDNPDSAEGSSHINPADFYTDPKMAKDFVDKTGVDALAIAVGTAHGAYKLPPKLDFERIHTIANTVDVPLVLHGGSGLTDNDFKRAIQEGISKINIFTDINVAAVEAEFRKFETMNKGIIDLIPAAVEAVKQETLKKMMLFSSNGKGTLNQPSQDELVKAVVQEVLRELGRK